MVLTEQQVVPMVTSLHIHGHYIFSVFSSDENNFLWRQGRWIFCVRGCFILWPLYPWEKSSCYSLDRRLGVN